MKFSFHNDVRLDDTVGEGIFPPFKLKGKYDFKTRLIKKKKKTLLSA